MRVLVNREDVDRMNSDETNTNPVSLDKDQGCCEELSTVSFKYTFIIAQVDVRVNGFLHNT